MKITNILSARKPTKCTKCGEAINVGDPYIKWGSRFTMKHKRCKKATCFPRPSELISSPFLQVAAELAEERDDAVKAFSEESCLDDLIAAIEGIAERFRELGEEAQGSFDNMPEGLQQGDTGQMLEQRASQCEDIASELDSLDLEAVWNEEAEDLPTVEFFEKATDEELKELAENFQVDEREADESKEDFIDRLQDELIEARNRAIEAVISAVEEVALEVE